MPSKQTKMGLALAAFRQSVRKVHQLLNIEKTYHDPPRPHETDAVDGLRAAAAILTIAVFETFVDELVLEHVGELSNRVSLTALAPKTLSRALYGTLEYAMRRRPDDPDNYRLNRESEIRAACARIVREQITPEAYLLDGSNPNSIAVSRIFLDLGLEDCFNRVHLSFQAAWGSAVAPNFLRNRLDEIVKLRHKAAHTGDGLSVSRLELGENPRFIETLSSQLDQLLASHVTTLP